MKGLKLKKCFYFVLVCICIASSYVLANESTWVEIDGVVYGARADERGPIGGGDGYVNIVTKGDFSVTDLDSLLEMLEEHFSLL